MDQTAVSETIPQPGEPACEPERMVLSPAQTDLAGFATLHHERLVGDIRVTHKSYTHDFAQSWHEHEAGTIDFVLAGGGRGIYAGREVISSPGMVEFFREEIRHRFCSHASGIRSMHIVLPGSMLRATRELRHTAVEELVHTRAISLATQVLLELGSPDASSDLQIESLLHELIDEVTQTASGPIPRAGWIGRAREALHDSDTAPVSLSQLAAILNIDRAHLARTFKARMGLSVGEYHRRVRLERAARLIASTDEPLVRIARRCGFSDQAHLTRAFRQHIGATPARYRQLLRRR